jgi:hypothetical protein
MKMKARGAIAASCCELDFIEQCWGYTKRVYRNFPPSKSEMEMEIYIMYPPYFQILQSVTLFHGSQRYRGIANCPSMQELDRVGLQCSSTDEDIINLIYIHAF